MREFGHGIPMDEAIEFDRTNEGDRMVAALEGLRLLMGKNRTGSRSEFEFISKGPIGKTVGLSYKPEAQ